MAPELGASIFTRLYRKQKRLFPNSEDADTYLITQYINDREI